MKESVSISVGTDFFVCKGDTNFCKIVTMTVLNRQLRKVSNGSGAMVTKSEKGVYRMQKGHASILFEDPPRIVGGASVVGKKESEGPLGNQFDQVIKEDRAGQDCWEMAESAMQIKAAEMAIRKAGRKKTDIRYLFSGDLLGQLIATSFGTGSLEIPLFGLYGACSTMGEAMSLGAMTVHGGYADRVLAMASSHFATAEKEFRFPLAYGSQRPFSATWTVTGCGAVVIEKAVQGNDKVKIRGLTTGRVIDLGVRDSMNMGAAMAPAACDTIYHHFCDFGTKPEDYDKIITGDLGYVGQEILIKLLLDKGYDISGVHTDCGIEIFDRQTQGTDSGGSGCGCAAVTLSAHFLKKIAQGEWKKILFVPTGALLSTVSFNEGQNVPGIAHAVVIEHEE